MPIDELFESRLPVIEAVLDNLIPETEEKYNQAVKAMRYSLLSGGKRIRPVLLMEFYKLCGGEDEKALNFAAALEMIHTYSLIHDDLPSMDNDDMRRGKPSCHKAFGEDTALLAGDALLTRAFSVAAKTEGLPAERVIKAISVLADKAGIEGMVGGQVMDLAFEKSGTDLDGLSDMYIKKTSGLLCVAAMCGAILAGADEEHIKYAESYANDVGLAFQIIDDILDCTADEKLLGKPIGSDVKNGKSTFASILGVEGAREYAKKLTNRAIDTLKMFEGDTDALIELTSYLLDRKY